MQKLLQALAIATALSFGFTQSGIPQEKQTPKVEVQVSPADSIPVASTPKTSGPETTTTDVVGGGVQPDGPAPPLTKVFINNVCSPTACETINVNELQTVNTYSGSNVYVYVWEIGYGNGEIATQGGATIANTYLVGKTSVCQSGSNYVTPCANGQTVIGWRYEWNVGYYLNLNYAENFNAQDTSEVLPYNTYSAHIQINYSH